MRFTLIVGLVLGSILSIAQPDLEDVRIRSNEDASSHEDDALESAEWVLQTDDVLDSEQWSEVSNFILNWSRFTDVYPIRMRTELTQFMKKTPELTTVYLAGWIQFAMNNKDESDSEAACTTAALEACAQFYGKNAMRLGKNDEMLAIVRKDMEGSLKDWVAGELARLNELGDR